MRRVKSAHAVYGSARRRRRRAQIDAIERRAIEQARGAQHELPEILCAAVLHDVVEDTPATVDDVRERFGDRVAAMVGWVTKPEPEDGADRKAAKNTYLSHLKDAPDDAIVVKLADRASNVQTLRNLGLPKQREYYAQTVAYIMPLAASRAWWADWYADWQEAHRDLG